MRLELCLIAASVLMLSSCKKDTAEPIIIEYPTGYVIPNTYAFVDENNNNTVSMNGQEQRLEMLSEMVVYLKTANTSGTAVSESQLKAMYANAAYTWTDAGALGMTGSSKQLKSKTAASAGSADPAIQLYFENLMDSIAAISATTAMGVDDGGNNQAGVVLSSNGTSKYLMDQNGHEFTQLIEKGLMGAVFYNQISAVYLSPAKMNVDNITPVDPAAGKHYTTMEHHWDEAYGYFTSAVDFPTNGTDRFWSKYANGREAVLGSATNLSLAFRTGRAAIANDDMAVRDAQIAVIREELEDVCAGTAIHYLNGAISNFADDALRNHELSEASAFIQDLIYGHNASITAAQIQTVFDLIGDDYYEVTVAGLTAARDELATIFAMESIKNDL
jgi:hypothetical protein